MTLSKLIKFIPSYTLILLLLLLCFNLNCSGSATNEDPNPARGIETGTPIVGKKIKIFPQVKEFRNEAFFVVEFISKNQVEVKRITGDFDDPEDQSLVEAVLVDVGVVQNNRLQITTNFSDGLKFDFSFVINEKGFIEGSQLLLNDILTPAEILSNLGATNYAFLLVEELCQKAISCEPQVQLAECENFFLFEYLELDGNLGLSVDNTFTLDEIAQQINTGDILVHETSGPACLVFISEIECSKVNATPSPFFWNAEDPIDGDPCAESLLD